jgi:hypothetical protein
MNGGTWLGKVKTEHIKHVAKELKQVLPAKSKSCQKELEKHKTTLNWKTTS